MRNVLWYIPSVRQVFSLLFLACWYEEKWDGEKAARGSTKCTIFYGCTGVKVGIVGIMRL